MYTHVQDYFEVHISNTQAFIAFACSTEQGCFEVHMSKLKVLTVHLHDCTYFTMDVQHMALVFVFMHLFKVYLFHFFIVSVHSFFLMYIFL